MMILNCIKELPKCLSCDPDGLLSCRGWCKIGRTLRWNSAEVLAQSQSPDFSCLWVAGKKRI